MYYNNEPGIFTKIISKSLTVALFLFVGYALSAVSDGLDAYDAAGGRGIHAVTAGLDGFRNGAPDVAGTAGQVITALRFDLKDISREATSFDVQALAERGISYMHRIFPDLMAKIDFTSDDQSA